MAYLVLMMLDGHPSNDSKDVGRLGIPEMNDVGIDVVYSKEDAEYLLRQVRVPYTHILFREGIQYTDIFHTDILQDFHGEIISGPNVEALFEILESITTKSIQSEREKEMNCTLTLAGLELNTVTRAVRIKSSFVHLTELEFNLLHVLLTNYPNIVPREVIERELWLNKLPESDVLKSILNTLRNKLRRMESDVLIQTVPKKGYRLQTTGDA